MSCRYRLGAIAATIVVAIALLTGCDRIQTWLQPHTCSLCSRPVHAGMAVSFEIEGHDPAQACCLRCVISYAQATGANVRVFSVTDYVAHDTLGPEDATYLTGSQLTPCSGPPVEVPASRRESLTQQWDRCLPSVIAFAKRQDAEHLRESAGGAILSFADLTRGTTVRAAGSRPEPAARAGKGTG